MKSILWSKFQILILPQRTLERSDGLTGSWE